MLNTDLMGKISLPFAPIVNILKEAKPVRVMLENFMGVDRRAKLPSFNNETFPSWFSKNRNAVTGKNGKVALFYTCLLNYNYLEKGKALVRVFEKNDIHIELPNQQCCGIPFFDVGDMDAVIEKAKFNIKALKEYVDKGYSIVVPIPTCALQIKYEYPPLASG